jgi:hypothetical protein
MLFAFKPMGWSADVHEYGAIKYSVSYQELVLFEQQALTARRYRVIYHECGAVSRTNIGSLTKNVVLLEQQAHWFRVHHLVYGTVTQHVYEKSMPIETVRLPCCV